MSAKNPSGLTSYSYEVTFGAGTLGINLQATRSGKGAYVDSFHRPPDKSVLPAEQSGYIKLGDIVLAINGEDVSDLSLSELPKVIERAKRPVTMKLERGNMELSFAEVVRDPRKLPWFMQYIVEKFGIEEAVHEQAKLMLWLECEQYIANEVNVPDGDYSDQALMILRKFFRPQSNFSLLALVPDKLRTQMLSALADAEERARTHSSGPSTPVTPSSLLLPSDHNHLGIDTPSAMGGSLCVTPNQQGDLCGSPDHPHHKLYREAQKWAERDMKSGSFLQFCSSMVSARMVGNLRYSPPFVQISLLELLRCDKKSVFLLLHMCYAKRHGILHCYNLLKNRPEENIEGGVRAAEEMLRVAISCVHVLGLDEGRSGVEDLPMLTRLQELLPSSVEQSNLLKQPMPSKLRALSAGSGGSAAHGISITSTYLDSLQTEMTLSIPLSEAMKSLARSASASATIQEIRRLLRSLRTAILRELSTEIVPKFFASNEFEILLWELDAHKLYLEAENKLKRMDDTGCSNDASFDSTDEDAELVKSFSHMVKKTPQASQGLRPQRAGSKGYSLVAEVPDGAVQRLLRKISASLPSSITMHRAPLDLLQEMSAERKQVDVEPMAWLILFDTQGGRLLNPSGIVKNAQDVSEHTPNKQNGGSTGSGEEIVKVVGVVPISAHKGSVGQYPDSTEIIPDGITSFLVPGGKCAHEMPTSSATTNSAQTAAPPQPSLFNMVVATRDSSLMYGSALLLHRKETVRVPVHNAVPVDVEGEDVQSHGGGRHSRAPMHTPSSIHRSHRPPPHTPKAPASSVFKPLPPVPATPKVPRPTDLPQNTPARAGAGGGYGEWIGQMSSMKTRNSPFLDRFKGGISNLTALAATPQGAPLQSRGDDVRGSDMDERGESVQSSSPPPAPEKSSSGIAVGGDSRVDGEDSGDGRDDGMHDVDLYVSYGVCVLTRIPCINALRVPLTKLASDADKLAASLTWSRPDGLSVGGDLPTPAEQATRILEQLDLREDAFSSLRQCYDHSIESIRAPTVLRWGGAQDFSMEMILRTLTPKNFVTILIAFILEYKVVVVSSRLTVLTALGELLKTLIAPLRWSHVYVPLVPKKISSQILQCPTPFFVGMHRESFDPSSTPSDVIILDMDSDACRITAELAKALYAGRRLAKELESVLRPEISMCDDIASPAPPPPPSTSSKGAAALAALSGGGDTQGNALREALRLCKLFVADVLVGVEVCCTQAVDHDELVVLFDEDMFSSYKARRSPKEESLFPLDKAFLDQLMRTQAFSLCVAGAALKKVNPDSRPPSRPSSPYVSIPTPSAAAAAVGESSVKVAPLQLFT